MCCGEANVLCVGADSQRLSLVDKDLMGEMETIKEEDTPPNSAASTKDDSPPSTALDRATSSRLGTSSLLHTLNQARIDSTQVLNSIPATSHSQALSSSSSSSNSATPADQSQFSSHTLNQSYSCSETTPLRLSPRLQVTDASDA